MPHNKRGERVRTNRKRIQKSKLKKKIIKKPKKYK